MEGGLNFKDAGFIIFPYLFCDDPKRKEKKKLRNANTISEISTLIVPVTKEHSFNSNFNF